MDYDVPLPPFPSDVETHPPEEDRAIVHTVQKSRVRGYSTSSGSPQVPQGQPPKRKRKREYSKHSDSRYSSSDESSPKLQSSCSSQGQHQRRILRGFFKRKELPGYTGENRDEVELGEWSEKKRDVRQA